MGSVNWKRDTFTEKVDTTVLDTVVLGTVLSDTVLLDTVARDTVRTAVLSGTVLTEEPPDTRMVPTDMLLVEATEMDTEPHTATATEMDTDTAVKVTNTREFTHSKLQISRFPSQN